MWELGKLYADGKETRVLAAFLLSAHCGIQPHPGRLNKEAGANWHSSAEVIQRWYLHYYNCGCFFYAWKNRGEKAGIE